MSFALIKIFLSPSLPPAGRPSHTRLTQDTTPPPLAFRSPPITALSAARSLNQLNNVQSDLIKYNAMAPPIATPQRRGDGFAVMEAKLKTLFFDQFKAKSSSVEGLAHTTRRHLTIAFTAAVNCRRQQ
jgi:hypothetical protein